MSEPVRVGLVGAGPWAELAHAPVLAHGPDTTLVAVWARRAEAAQELAAKHGAFAVDRLEDLYDRCDAVAFCVPPAVQAQLAAGAAAAGKALLLEKPIAADLAGAEQLVAEVADAGVPSMLVLTWRYASAVRAFLDQAASFDAYGGRGSFLAAGLLAGPFRTPWRLDAGPLLDLGPHVIDLMDAALGPVTGVRANGRLDRWVVLELEHEGGAVSESALCSHTALAPSRCRAELYGESGVLEIDTSTAVGPAAFATLQAELAAMVRTGRAHALDVGRGLHLQRVIEQATTELTAR